MRTLKPAVVKQPMAVRHCLARAEGFKDCVVLSPNHNTLMMMMVMMLSAHLPPLQLGCASAGQVF